MNNSSEMPRVHMNLQDQRDLTLLSEVERGGSVTQRSLARELNVALGLINLYLKRLARKGYIKVTSIPRNRIQYLLTPRGLTEKSRLTYEYMQYSLTYYRDMRQRLREALSGLSASAGKRIAIYGTGELAELAYLSVREADLILLGFVDEGKACTFLSHPVWPVDVFAKMEFDAVLISDLKQAMQVRDRLTDAGVPVHKIISPFARRAVLRRRTSLAKKSNGRPVPGRGFSGTE